MCCIREHDRDWGSRNDLGVRKLDTVPKLLGYVALLVAFVKFLEDAALLVAFVKFFESIECCIREDDRD